MLSDPSALSAQCPTEITALCVLQVEGHTSAPSALTESDLIGLMETHGIGTDATIAEHIKKVLERSYVEKRSALFYPTTIGTMLLKGYTDCGFDLGKPELRAEMERAVDKVAAGQQSKRDAIDHIISLMRPLYGMAAKAVHKLHAAAAAAFAPTDTSSWRVAPLADSSRPTCGGCGGPMQMRVQPPSQQGGGCRSAVVNELGF